MLDNRVAADTDTRIFLPRLVLLRQFVIYL
jgi:hypothetical protein